MHLTAIFINACLSEECSCSIDRIRPALDADVGLYYTECDIILASYNALRQSRFVPSTLYYLLNVWIWKFSIQSFLLVLTTFILFLQCFAKSSIFEYFSLRYHVVFPAFFDKSVIALGITSWVSGMLTQQRHIVIVKLCIFI